MTVLTFIRGLSHFCEALRCRLQGSQHCFLEFSAFWLAVSSKIVKSESTFYRLEGVNSKASSTHTPCLTTRHVYPKTCSSLICLDEITGQIRDQFRQLTCKIRRIEPATLPEKVVLECLPVIIMHPRPRSLELHQVNYMFLKSVFLFLPISGMNKSGLIWIFTAIDQDSDAITKELTL